MGIGAAPRSSSRLNLEWMWKPALKFVPVHCRSPRSVLSRASTWERTWGRTMGKLTDRTVRMALPGRHGDDAVRGLMLVVQPGGSRSWMLRYQLNGRRRDMGLGP